MPPTRRPARGLGGSVVAEVLGIPAKALPELDYDWFARACTFVREAIRRGLVSAVRDISDGGALVAIAEMAFASVQRGFPVGFRIDLWTRAEDLDEQRLPLACEAVWSFVESPGFVLEVPPSALDGVQKLANAHGIFSTGPLGFTIAEAVVEVRSEDDEIVESVPLADLREAWEAPLRAFYGA
jgi:phosphoribosylformylglycinamidine synthase